MLFLEVFGAEMRPSKGRSERLAQLLPLPSSYPERPPQVPQKAMAGDSGCQRYAEPSQNAASWLWDLLIVEGFATRRASSTLFGRVPFRRTAMRRPSWPAACVQTEIGQTLFI